ncbi:MAG: hypothetical protein SFU25_09085 [Candidatus Caenarcaniphilales bacterium]|nr:hypothetical protein [Candidatus Caenarcaniphilales bacterium]
MSFTEAVPILILISFILFLFIAVSSLTIIELIGNFFFLKGDYSNVINIFSFYLKFENFFGDKRVFLAGKSKIGIAQYNLGDHKRAEESLTQSITVALEDMKMSEFEKNLNLTFDSDDIFEITFMTPADSESFRPEYGIGYAKPLLGSYFYRAKIRLISQNCDFALRDLRNAQMLSFALNDKTMQTQIKDLARELRLLMIKEGNWNEEYFPDVEIEEYKSNT